MQFLTSQSRNSWRKSPEKFFTPNVNKIHWESSPQPSGFFLEWIPGKAQGGSARQRLSSILSTFIWQHTKPLSTGVPVPSNTKIPRYRDGGAVLEALRALMHSFSPLTSPQGAHRHADVPGLLSAIRTYLCWRMVLTAPKKCFRLNICCSAEANRPQIRPVPKCFSQGF